MPACLPLLLCYPIVDPSSPQADISWRKDGSPLSASGSLSFSQADHVLTITGVSTGNAGTYSCVATQESNTGPRESTAEAEITVVGEDEWDGGEGVGGES